MMPEALLPYTGQRHWGGALYHFAEGAGRHRSAAQVGVYAGAPAEWEETGGESAGAGHHPGHEGGRD